MIKDRQDGIDSIIELAKLNGTIKRLEELAIYGRDFGSKNLLKNIMEGIDPLNYEARACEVLGVPELTSELKLALENLRQAPFLDPTGSVELLSLDELIASQALHRSIYVQLSKLEEQKYADYRRPLTEQESWEVGNRAGILARGKLAGEINQSTSIVDDNNLARPATPSPPDPKDKPIKYMKPQGQRALNSNNGGSNQTQEQQIDQIQIEGTSGLASERKLDGITSAPEVDLGPDDIRSGSRDTAERAKIKGYYQKNKDNDVLERPITEVIDTLIEPSINNNQTLPTTVNREMQEQQQPLKTNIQGEQKQEVGTEQPGVPDPVPKQDNKTRDMQSDSQPLSSGKLGVERDFLSAKSGQGARAFRELTVNTGSLLAFFDLRKIAQERAFQRSLRILDKAFAKAKDSYQHTGLADSAIILSAIVAATEKTYFKAEVYSAKLESIMQDPAALPALKTSLCITILAKPKYEPGSNKFDLHPEWAIQGISEQARLHALQYILEEKPAGYEAVLEAVSLTSEDRIAGLAALELVKIWHNRESIAGVSVPTLSLANLQHFVDLMGIEWADRQEMSDLALALRTTIAKHDASLREFDSLQKRIKKKYPIITSSSFTFDNAESLRIKEDIKAKGNYRLLADYERLAEVQASFKSYTNILRTVDQGVQRIIENRMNHLSQQLRTYARDLGIPIPRVGFNATNRSLNRAPEQFSNFSAGYVLGNGSIDLYNKNVITVNEITTVFLPVVGHELIHFYRDCQIIRSLADGSIVAGGDRNSDNVTDLDTMNRTARTDLLMDRYRRSINIELGHLSRDFFNAVLANRAGQRLSDSETDQSKACLDSLNDKEFWDKKVASVVKLKTELANILGERKIDLMALNKFINSHKGNLKNYLQNLLSADQLPQKLLDRFTAIEDALAKDKRPAAALVRAAVNDLLVFINQYLANIDTQFVDLKTADLAAFYGQRAHEVEADRGAFRIRVIATAKSYEKSLALASGTDVIPGQSLPNQPRPQPIDQQREQQQQASPSEQNNIEGSYDPGIIAGAGEKLSAEKKSILRFDRPSPFVAKDISNTTSVWIATDWSDKNYLNRTVDALISPAKELCNPDFINLMSTEAEYAMALQDLNELLDFSITGLMASDGVVVSNGLIEKTLREISERVKNNHASMLIYERFLRKYTACFTQRQSSDYSARLQLQEKLASALKEINSSKGMPGPKVQISLSSYRDTDNLVYYEAGTGVITIDPLFFMQGPTVEAAIGLLAEQNEAYQKDLVRIALYQQLSDGTINSAQAEYERIVGSNLSPVLAKAVRDLRQNRTITDEERTNISHDKNFADPKIRRLLSEHVKHLLDIGADCTPEDWYCDYWPTDAEVEMTADALEGLAKELPEFIKLAHAAEEAKRRCDRLAENFERLTGLSRTELLASQFLLRSPSLEIERIHEQYRLLNSQWSDFANGKTELQLQMASKATRALNEVNKKRRMPFVEVTFAEIESVGLYVAWGWYYTNQSCDLSSIPLYMGLCFYTVLMRTDISREIYWP